MTDFVFNMNLIQRCKLTNYITFIVQNTAKETYIIKEHYNFTIKTPIIITEAVYTVKLISYLHRTHFCTVVSDERILQRFQSASAPSTKHHVSVVTHLNASDWSLHS